jgi:DUF971 family protein
MSDTRIEPVRHYAVQFCYFSDGHDTGIYSWTLLTTTACKQEEMWRHYLSAWRRGREPRVFGEGVTGDVTVNDG